MLRLEQDAFEGDANSQYGLATIHALTLSSPELQTLLFFSASTGGHPLALLAQGWRHLQGVGVPQSCQTSALYYLEVARSVAGVYSRTVPQAVELVRLSLHDVTGAKPSEAASSHHEISMEEMSLLNSMALSDRHVAFQLAKRHLLGTEGVTRSYGRAIELLSLHPSDARCLGLLGYMHVMGLGLTQDSRRAKQLFTDALAADTVSADAEWALAWNGLGYLEYTEGRFEEAFAHFNSSAHAGSSDGLFNLASLYLSGQGTAQSFQRAYIYYSQAAEMGHTPATYALGILLLNGIGVGRDCKGGVRLLKEVGERSPAVAELLSQARKNFTRSPQTSLLYYALLAEAGVEVAQSNAAFLIEKSASLPFIGGPDLSVSVASQQRYLELSADQGGVSSELKLGDLAYYGKGVETVLSSTGDFAEVQLQKRAGPDFPLALVSYRKCLDASSSDASLASVAAFNLGYMHQLGEGVDRDFRRALEFYERSMEKSHPFLLGLVRHGLALHEYLTESFSWQRLREDWRVRTLPTALALLPVLVLLRRRLIVIGV